MMEENSTEYSSTDENYQSNDRKSKLTTIGYIGAICSLICLILVMFLPISTVMTVFLYLLAGMLCYGIYESFESQNRRGLQNSLYTVGILFLLATVALFVFTNLPVLGLFSLAALALATGFCVQHYSEILTIAARVLAHDATKTFIGLPLVLLGLLGLTVLFSGPLPVTALLLTISSIAAPIIFAAIAVVAETWVAQNNADGWDKSSLRFSIVKGLRYCLNIINESDTLEPTKKTEPSTYGRNFVDFRPCASQVYQDPQSGVWYYLAPVIISAPNTAAGYEADDDSTEESTTSETTLQ